MDTEKTKLEVGCGMIKREDKKKDTLYLDIVNFPNVDIIRDIERGLPFDNEKFEFIKAHHILEHIKDLIFVMNEFHRVLKMKGILEVEVPCGQNALIDPTHVRTFTKYGFNFFFIKDFNSGNAGVKGWFEPIKLHELGESINDVRGLRFTMRKK